MLFRKSIGLFLLLCMSLSCSPDESPKNVTKRCICHSNDDEHTVLKLHLIHIDAQDAKRLCDDIIVSIDYEFSSISIAADSRSNLLILTGRAYEVHLLEWNFRRKELAFRHDEYSVSVLKLLHIDAQKTKNLCDKLITSIDASSQISVTAEPRTNSLILAGPAHTIYKMEEFIVKYVDILLLSRNNHSGGIISDSVEQIET